ncbi:MAG TPA: hypothetical protein VGO11_12625 [Chthoniobacteraceae bacterium]|jgi:hypothetical protein|nr:hypothetical protein [Chthoniobacteraceae bacterium]
MGDFALVTEGVSDHQILRNVLLGYYKVQREPLITFEHPDPQAAQHTGGWTLVLRYLREKKFRQAFQTNSFVVVQVDTDVTEDRGFDVPKQDEHGPISLGAFTEKVVSRLQEEIGNEDWLTFGERFIFAIGVEQIECWVLPLWYAGAKGEQTANCAARLGANPNLRNELTAKNYAWITPNKKEPLSYDLASRGYRKRATLLAEGPRSPSLSVFLRQLQDRAIVLPPAE